MTFGESHKVTHIQPTFTESPLKEENHCNYYYIGKITRTLKITACTLFLRIQFD